MSHISKIEVQIKSLEDLKEACQQLGFQFMENQQNFKWYGEWIGDSPLPEGMKVEDIGKCDHAIRIKGCDYEIGVIKRDNHYQLFWDNWYRGGLKKAIGKDAGVIKQAYSTAKIRKEAKLKGYKVIQKKLDQNIRLILTR
ncbi:MAG: DUF1257 domain-containing protein [Desulfobacterales bacterium]|nr:DUF1257 domain-containing protein [Desulfobacterales bacterium]